MLTTRDSSEVVFVYLDHQKVSQQIASMIGDVNYGAITQGNLSTSQMIRELVLKTGIRNVIHVTNKNLEEFEETTKNLSENMPFIFFSAELIVRSLKDFENVLIKMIDSNVSIYSERLNPKLVALTSKRDAYSFLKSNFEVTRFDVTTLFPTAVQLLDTEALVNLSEISIFLNFFTSGFKARHFNDVRMNNFTVIKKSKEVNKIANEYKFYKLLPEEMQRWFVQPYNLVVEKDFATYEMEKVNFPDLSLLWVSNAFTLNEFDIAINKIFMFIEKRSTKEIGKDQYFKIADSLYKEKVYSRINLFKDDPMRRRINDIINSITRYKGLDHIVDTYIKLYEKNSPRINKYVSVIGHGDLCFSNILYDKKTDSLKLIDPKGALEESDLWTNPYYDLAKLSHSILGLYDFTNRGLFDVVLNEENFFEMRYHQKNLDAYRKLFIEKCIGAGHDPFIIRMFEASLFISMLPLHIEDEKKVLGFILTTINILEELAESDK